MQAARKATFQTPVTEPLCSHSGEVPENDEKTKPLCGAAARTGAPALAFPACVTAQSSQLTEPLRCSASGCAARARTRKAGRAPTARSATVSVGATYYIQTKLILSCGAFLKNAYYPIASSSVCYTLKIGNLRRMRRVSTSSSGELYLIKRSAEAGR